MTIREDIQSGWETKFRKALRELRRRPSFSFGMRTYFRQEATVYGLVLAQSLDDEFRTIRCRLCHVERLETVIYKPQKKATWYLRNIQKRPSTLSKP